MAQVIAYAVTKQCQKVVLVYPTSFTHPLDKVFGNIRVRSLPFSLDGDLEQAGKIFLEKLFS